MRYTICYVSTAIENLEQEKLEQLLQKWKEKNNDEGFKGILLYSEGNFFQVLEGEKRQLLELFENIRKDKRHHSVIQILGKEIDQTGYDGYDADFVTEKNKYSREAMERYYKPLDGMDVQTKEVAKRMLDVFIETSK
ncbi:BLUF domain-containing protein [Antarcticibacterium sp. 1MA-6-2]|uniref:BLUF domain-containing protein n=1 Tax=Antarcticibacterium sp. 1MA-6-2 TaxID=2908210 RepID=UPI001F19DB31|nr:BLUF domain-containing protein [Antarcticibacterium sp. 1MA-6-2]UJH92847.1 BLUF domain-containing protein [Antarcticibacterium sp. 1MA-6-2]